jgi:hypothetical protein
MWAYTIVRLRAVTVPAQDLETRREVVLFQPSVCFHDVPVLLFHLPPMVGAIFVDVVDGEELQSLLSAADALGATVGVEHQLLEEVSAPLIPEGQTPFSLTGDS